MLLQILIELNIDSAKFRFHFPFPLGSHKPKCAPSGKGKFKIGKQEIAKYATICGVTAAIRKMPTKVPKLNQK